MIARTISAERKDCRERLSCIAIRFSSCGVRSEGAVAELAAIGGTYPHRLPLSGILWEWARSLRV
jgi:hypothetical protein